MKAQILAYVLTALILTNIHLAGAQPTKVAHIGFLDASTASGMAVLVDVFRQELSKLGWIETKNITIDYRFAENKGAERLTELAAELVRLKVDFTVVTWAAAALPAKSATTIILIVIANATDPVAAGLLASLARQRGNVTGVTAHCVELNTKRLEILKDAVPRLTQFGLRRPLGAY